MAGSDVPQISGAAGSSGDGKQPDGADDARSRQGVDEGAGEGGSEGEGEEAGVGPGDGPSETAMDPCGVGGTDSGDGSAGAPASQDDSESAPTLLVTVPEGCTPGQPFRVPLPTGELVQVVAPSDFEPGTQMTLPYSRITTVMPREETVERLGKLPQVMAIVRKNAVPSGEM